MNVRFVDVVVFLVFREFRMMLDDACFVDVGLSCVQGDDR